MTHEVSPDVPVPSEVTDALKTASDLGDALDRVPADQVTEEVKDKIREVAAHIGLKVIEETTEAPDIYDDKDDLTEEERAARERALRRDAIIASRRPRTPITGLITRR